MPVASAPDWLPAGRRAAVCFSIDDVHPATSDDAYEAGGDLARGALGRVARLLERHPRLRVTLFVSPDWRPLELVARRSLRTRVPWLRERVFWAARHPPGRMRLERHPEFVRHLNDMPRTEVALHGLHHSHPGPSLAVEFQHQNREECTAMLRRALEIVERAGLRIVRGFQPPGWNLPPPLLQALGDLRFRFVSSARDVATPVSPDAVTAMSGLRGVSLVAPQCLDGTSLLHVTSNFQATSPPERAYQILDQGGLLAVKAHIFKTGGGHSMLDGLDDAYCNYLDLLFTTLEERYGDSLWWTSMNELRERVVGRC